MHVGRAFVEGLASMQRDRRTTRHLHDHFPFEHIHQHLIIVPVDYSENKRVLIDELARKLAEFE